MRFQEFIRKDPVILAEGAVIERLKREFNRPLDPYVLHAGWVYDSDRRRVMENIWRGYLDIGQRYDLPMVILTPTWRASIERVRLAGLPGVEDVNRRGAQLLSDLRNERGIYGDKILIGGLIGPCGDAYNPRDALTERDACDYHRLQLQVLTGTDVDFLIACTLPALSEARGIAAAMAETRLPFLISFVLRRDGTLLDGTPLHEAIVAINRETRPQPTAYLINCVHPRNFLDAMSHECAIMPDLCERIVGLQANTSALSPEDLDRAESAQGDDPDSFADGMIEVHRRFRTKILGGCCGTNDRHIGTLAAALVS